MSDDQKSTLNEITKELEVLTLLHESKTDNYAKVLELCEKKNIGDNFIGFIEHEIARFLKSNPDILDDYKKSLVKIVNTPYQLKYNEFQCLSNKLYDEVENYYHRFRFTQKYFTTECDEIRIGYINNSIEKLSKLMNELKILLEIPEKYKYVWASKPNLNKFKIMFRDHHDTTNYYNEEGVPLYAEMQEYELFHLPKWFTEQVGVDKFFYISVTNMLEINKIDN